MKKSPQPKYEKIVGQPTTKAKQTASPAPKTATRASQPNVPKDGTDGSIALRPQRTGSE